MKRKGVSPVIATLLLIVIAVAAAVLTYIWVTGYMGTLQAQAGTQQVQERVKIEGVKISGNKLSELYVRNIGDVRLNISAVYLLDSAGATIGQSTLTGGQIVGPEALATITSLPQESLNAGETYIVKVVTTRGTEATYQFTYRP
ncbi:MAG: hypothetical protein NZ954_06990 [Thermofilaceae archaeon]|nr:hypothetical protein [Thermofilaceae archaeon]MCX8179746.1 hypothetical protein [Thermofilaceae archaeon]MDW8004274.1 archaellin/type IV pilin N-terminal domain-containing protein [Thermofilaceae archaeon]